MAKHSAGLLLYRRAETGLFVLLAHPGGPFWARRDQGAWTIPKGEYGPDEEPLAAARREFAEELGQPAPAGPALDLGTIRQRAGKEVRAFALEGDLDPATVRSNEVEIAWPPRSGRRMRVPEIDRAAWFGMADAAERILPAQAVLLERLEAQLQPRARIVAAGS